MFKKVVALWAVLPLLSLIAAGAQAADEIVPGPWRFSGVGGLNLSQSTFSDNWAGGDQGAVAWVINANLGAERQFNEAFNWSNKLELAYGQTNQQGPDPDDSAKKKWGRPQKSTDKILFESTGRWHFRWPLDPYVSLRLDSQFVDESDPIKNFLINPVKLSETAGLARVFHKTEESELISRFGFGFRQTFARAVVDVDTEDTDTFNTNDGGFEWKTDATYPLFDKKVRYKGELLVFLPVFYSGSDKLKEFDTIALGVDPTREEVQDFWRAVDVNFQNTFTAQITEIISVNLFVHFLYDKFDAATNVDTALAQDVLIREIDGGVRKASQFKQTLALGLTYKFF